MQHWKRASVLLLAILLMLTALVGCSEDDKQNRKVIGTCAGFDVLYEELRYVTLSYKDMFAATYGQDIWATPESAETYRAELEETVGRVMLNNYAVLAACNYYMGDAMAAGAMEDKDIVAAVDAQIEELKNSYKSESDYKAALKAMYVSEHFLRFTLTVAQLENELLHVLTQDLGLIEDNLTDFYEWLKDGNSVYVQHIFIENDKGEDKEANRQKAESVRDQLRADPNAIIALSGDVTVDDDLANINPYYIVRDVYVESVETAALSLGSVGDVSDVIEVENGFYVLIRMEDSEQTLLAQSTALLDSYQWAKVEAEVDSFRDDIALELNDYGKTIDLLAIR